MNQQLRNKLYNLVDEEFNKATAALSVRGCDTKRDTQLPLVRVHMGAGYGKVNVPKDMPDKIKKAIGRLEAQAKLVCAAIGVANKRRSKLDAAHYKKKQKLRENLADLRVKAKLSVLQADSADTAWLDELQAFLKANRD